MSDDVKIGLAAQTIESRDCISIGHGARARGIGAIAIGAYAQAYGDGAMAFGRASHAEGSNAVAIGDCVESIGHGKVTVKEGYPLFENKTVEELRDLIRQACSSEALKAAWKQEWEDERRARDMAIEAEEWEKDREEYREQERDEWDLKEG